MKNFKRTFVLTAILALFVLNTAAFSNNGPADSNEVITYSKKSVVNYSEALKSENRGVVESAIFYSVKFKLFNPEENTAPIEDQLQNLVANGETEKIRYKAQIAVNFVRNPELMENITRENYKDTSDVFFKLLANELESKYLVKR